MTKEEGKENGKRSSWPRTHTPWQRCAPHAAPASQAHHLLRPLEAVACVAVKRHGIADAKLGTRVAAEPRRTRVLAGFQVVFWTEFWKEIIKKKTFIDEQIQPTSKQSEFIASRRKGLCLLLPHDQNCLRPFVGNRTQLDRPDSSVLVSNLQGGCKRLLQWVES